MLHYDTNQDDYPMGDPRRCPHHPHVRTSSDDGLFDAPCGACENEGDRWQDLHDQGLSDAEIAVIMAQPVVYYTPSPPAAVDTDDGIPF